MLFPGRIRKWWGAKLGRRLLALFTATMVVSFTLLGVLSLRTGQANVQNQVEEGNARLAALAAKEINAQYDTIISDAQRLRYELEEPSATLLRQVRTLLELRRTAPLTYRALYILDGEGELLVHLADPLQDLLAIESLEEIIRRPPIPLTGGVTAAFEEARSGNLYLSSARIAGADQVPIVYMGIPLAVDEAKPRQIVVVEVDLRDIWRRIDEINVGQTGRAFITSREGAIIAHPDRSYIGQPLPLPLEPVLAGYEGQTEYTDPISGRVMLASYSPVGKQSGWGIVIEQEQAEALAPATRIAVVTLIVSLIAVLMVGFISVMIARSISRPIQHLAHVTQTIAQTGDLEQNIQITSQDEVGQLAATFNQMIASLRKTGTQRDTAQKGLQRYAEQLEEMVKQRTRELQDAQEQLVRKEKLAILGQLAGGVGHELRNPLGVISNAVYYLRLLQPDADETAIEYLDIIAEQVHNSNKIVSDLLDFARTRRVDRVPVSVAVLVAQALERRPPPALIKVHTEIAPDLPPVHVDTLQIGQVLDNLVTNAYQAMAPAGGDLTVRARETVPSGESRQNGAGMVTLSVSDTGCGITPENMARLFEPLFTTKARGIGLGLATAKNLMEANGGAIQASSQVGQGSTFTLLLPTEETRP